MSSKSVDEKRQELLDDASIKEASLNLKDLIISFSKFGTSSSSKYIYHGHERIPFKNRHPAYQAILRHEFAGVMREFKKRYIATKKFI